MNIFFINRFFKSNLILKYKTHLESTRIHFGVMGTLIESNGM